jgi:hypothetical protein
MAALKLQNAQEVIGVRQIAPCCDKLTIKVLGTTDITGLMRRKGFRNSSHFIDADLRGSHRSRFECEALRKCDGDHRTSGRGAQRVDVVLHSQVSLARWSLQGYDTIVQWYLTSAPERTALRDQIPLLRPLSSMIFKAMISGQFRAAGLHATAHLQAVFP